MIEFAVKYKKKSILKVFFQCLRDFALQWLKNQFIKFTSLSDFKTIITKIFSFSLISEINFNQTIIDSSSQKYHRCFECDAQFSSTSRFLTHTQKNCYKNFTCKHCEKTFASNNKLHEHVRLHHIKESYNNKTLKQRFVERKDNYINFSISSFILLTTSTSSITFKSMTALTESSYLFIFMTKAQVVRFIEFSVDSSITSLNSVASIVSIEFLYFVTFSTTSESTSTILKFSHHSIIMMKTSIACFFTSSSSSIQTSMLNYQDSINSHRFHSAVYSKLIRDHKSSTTFVFSILTFKSMKQLNIASLTSTFTFKSTSTTTKSSQHSISMQKTFVICSFTSLSTSSRSLTLLHAASKTYMTMKELFEMFAEKTRKKNKSIIQKKSIFSCFSELRQTRIKSLCSQENLKNSIMITRKQFRKKWNIIHKRMRFSMFDQIQIINYFKFVD